MGRLDGKVALITGAGRGIGKALAIRFAAEGAKVVVTSMTPANVEKVVAEIRKAGGTAHGIGCDVNNADQIKSAVAEAVQTFGTIDILVNNAFDVSSAFSSVLDLTEEQLQAQFQCGPIAHLRFMKACYPYLENRDGRIINFASSVGVIGSMNLAPYAMAKEAIRALTRVAAREWGDKRITVNTICPIALTDSFAKAINEEGMQAPPTPIPRMGSPEEDIAPIAVFLASKDAQYMTGYTFMADGGFMIDTAR